MVVFFKQKTAYEMRISDWSSDVCSSDLEAGGARGGWDQPRGAAWRDPGGGRRERLRQVDAGAPAGAPHPPDNRAGALPRPCHRRPVGSGDARPSPRPAVRIPGPLLVAEPAHDGRHTGGGTAGAEEEP